MAAHSPICGEEILRLVEIVYKAAEDTTLWPKFLQRVSALMNATVGTLEVYNESQRSGNIEVSVNVDPEFLRDYASHFASKNPWHKGGSTRLPLDKAVTGNMWVADDVLFRSEFYQDFMKYVGAFHLAGGMLLESSGHNTSLSFFRPRTDEAFGPEELALLNVLLPHIKQALHLHHRIGAAEGGRRAIAEALDRIPLGVIVVDDCTRILATNRRAAEILAEKDGLASERDGLQASVPSQTAALRNLVAAVAVTSKGRGLHPGGVLTLKRPSLKEPLSARVIPVPLYTCLADHAKAAAVVFVSDPDARTTVNHLAVLYSLTPAEERLTSMLIEGYTLDELAAALQVSRNTAATQLKSVFQKTGTRRQADLVRLLLRSVAALTP